MRFLSLAIGALLVASAFVAGRVTASPPVAAAGLSDAQTFSHFECYTATFKKQFGATVQLTDQFQQYQTGVGPPQLFCTPVTKKVISGPHLRAPAPADHLTCYAIQGPTVAQSRPYSNQFVHNDTVQVNAPSMLCVPTHKTG